MLLNDRIITNDETKSRILIIEDDYEIAETMKLTFQIYWPEVEVLCFTLGQKGIESAIRQPPDLCITDLNLPDMHGFDVIRRLHSVSDIPIIVASCNNDQETINQAIEMGADAYFKKPFNLVELLNKINKLINRRSLILNKH